MLCVLHSIAYNSAINSGQNCYRIHLHYLSFFYITVHTMLVSCNFTPTFLPIESSDNVQDKVWRFSVEKCDLLCAHSPLRVNLY